MSVSTAPPAPPGDVVVTVLSNSDGGAPTAATLSAVESVLNDEDVRPLTDRLTVQAAQILPYEVEAVLTLYEGPDASLVQDAAIAALDDYIETHHRLGA